MGRRYSVDEFGDQQRIARDGIVRALTQELLGPSGGQDEEIQERPTLRYLIGRLAPAGTDVSPEEDDAAADEAGDDDGGVDRTAPISMSMSPSSIGLSVLVAPNEPALRVTATWGEYLRESRSHADEATGKAAERTVYVRTPVERSHIVPLGSGGGRGRE